MEGKHGVSDLDNSYSFFSCCHAQGQNKLNWLNWIDPMKSLLYKAEIKTISKTYKDNNKPDVSLNQFILL